jgi:pantetheine-phosphate adenylyltransferase
MNKLIALTGKIASGKSTARKLLESNNYTNFTHTIKFIDLDEVCKNIISEGKIDSFYLNYFNTTEINQDHISIIFSDRTLYNEYCETFSPYLYEYLTNLLQDEDTIYVVEASAFYSYPEIYELFGEVIHIVPTHSILARNRSNRNVDGNFATKVDTIFDFESRNFFECNVNDLILANGTLQELRGKIEAELIYAINSISHSEYLSQAISAICYLEDNFFQSNKFNPYHNKDHTRNVLTNLIISGNFTQELALSAIFHDYEYDPRIHNNEEISSQKTDNCLNNIFYNSGYFEDKITEEQKQKIVYNVKNSGYKDVSFLNDETLNKLFLSDISSFIQTPEEIIENCKLVAKEYSFCDWSNFKKSNLQVLKDIKQVTCIKNRPDYQKGLDIAIAFVEQNEPKIGFYCGSFNPFHKGHLDILKKAEQIFDKVVLVQAVNPNKDESVELANESLMNYEKITNVKNIPELLNSLNYIPTLIRGIRNYQDFIDSEQWIKQINEFTHNKFQCTMIQGDPNLNHISSSFIRNANDLGLYTSNFIVK